MKNARQTAFDILSKIQKDSSYSNLTIDSFLASVCLDEVDSAFVSALVYGVLESSFTLDYQLAANLKQPLKKLKPQVLTVLRLGAYQLLFMDKVPESAAVNESVKLIKANGKEPISFSLSDTEKAIKCGKPIVLVDCCDYSSDRRYIPDYRWYAVPENFGERNLKT